MLYKAILSFIMTCIISATAIGQLGASIIEGNTYFTGMTKSTDAFLRDQIFMHKEKALNLKSIEENVQLLKNIPGIIYAEHQLDTIENTIDVTYTVEEISTLVPIVNFGGISGNIWFRLGITDFNWLGKGQFLSATYQNNNGLHAGHVFFKIPRRHKSVWGYSASASSWSSEEPLFFNDGSTVNYIYNNHGLGLSAIRHFGNNTTVEMGNTAFLEIYNKVETIPGEILPGPDQLKQKKLLSKIAFARDFLNYDHFYRQGKKWSVTYQNVYTVNENIWFNALLLEGQYFYRPSKKVNIAVRVKFGLSTNLDSPFAPFVADSHINIRGIGNRISRGTAEAVFNVEYRKTLNDRKNWASQFVAFSDMGSWRNPGGKITEILNNDQFRHFVGVGGRLIYKKLFGATIRVDYGIDIYNPQDRGVVLGLGQYF